MKNAKGSKSARTPKTPAKGGKPEVTLEGTIVLPPNPGDAPAPPKGKRVKKGATVATPAAEVPDWAQRAAARDTAAEMAAMPETAAPVAETPTRKKGRAAKAKGKPAENVTPAAAPGSLRAIGDGWLDSLKAAGHTPSTISSYGNDLAIAYEHFGEVQAAALTEKQIAAFNASKGVTRTRTGKPKAQPTILKTRRALRLALTWAEQKGLIKKAPYATKTPA